MAVVVVDVVAKINHLGNSIKCACMTVFLNCYSLVVVVVLVAGIEETTKGYRYFCRAKMITHS